MKEILVKKIALGEAVPRTQESLFDSRLFNKTGGLDSGLADDEGYNIYDKRLFGGERERALYKAPKREESELYGDSQSIDEIANTKKFKPHKDFQGVDRTQDNSRSGPVQYEKDTTDDWGLNEFLHDKRESVKRKNVDEDRQNLGIMHAAGGGSGRAEDYRDGPGSRKRVRYEDARNS